MGDSWFRTWPERSYDKLDGSTPPTSPKHDPPAPVPLSSLLNHMSLAYSPITKGLHVLKTPSVPKIATLDDEVVASLRLDALEAKDCDNSVLNCLKSKRSSLESISRPWQKAQVSDDTLDIDDVCVWKSKNTLESGQETLNFGGKEPDPDVDFVARTEASSFSSIVSSLSDVTPSQTDADAVSTKADEDAKSQISFDCGEQSKFFTENSPKLVKKKSFSGFFSKGVLPWKNNSVEKTSGTNGWRFLGKTFLSSPSNLENKSGDQSHRGSSQSISDSGSQKYGDVVASSSALILHDRPPSLPAKTEEERVKHHQQYLDMVDAAKRKDEKVSKERKQSAQRQLKHEEQLANVISKWNNEIMPRWSDMRDHKKTRELWWAGLPPCVRGKVWRLAVANNLNITPQLYHICAGRASEKLKKSCSRTGTLNQEKDCDNNESNLEYIQLDVDRTFPQLCIFQKGGPYYDMLLNVLGAYVCYRPDVGYVQGMSFLAAILILNMDPPDAFICFANLLNRPCLHAFFTLSQPMVEAYYETYSELLKENLPRLSEHLIQAGLTPDLYLLDWVYSVFGKAVNLDVACRVWDVFLRDGEEFIFQTALGILHLYERELMTMDFVHGAQFLTRLPDNLSPDLLFKSIASINMTTGKLSFQQILTKHTAATHQAA